jgi:hypothetical protein
MLSAGDAAGRRLRSNGVAGSNQIAIGRRNLPGSHSDPNVRKPIYRDANRLVDQASFKGREPAAGRSSRVRKQVQAYTDTGSSTRKPQLAAEDCIDVIAGIMASMSQPLQQEQQPVERSNEEKHPEMTRKVKKRKSAFKENEKQLFQRRKEIDLARLSLMQEELLLTKSWLDRQEMAFLAYATALTEGMSKMLAYEAAAKAAFVCDRTVRSWCPQYAASGEFVSNNWGKSITMPSAFHDTEVKLKGAKWWRDHPPKKAEPSARIIDFKQYMIGTLEEPGPMRHVMEDLGKDDYSEEMFRQFTHDLGFGWEAKDKGTFNDEHEAIANQQDRRNRFLPEYFRFYENSPHTYKGHDVDDLDDIDVRNRHFVTIAGTDGVTRKISLGGELPRGVATVCL